jgi:hypothetical protein
LTPTGEWAKRIAMTAEDRLLIAICGITITG